MRHIAVGGSNGDGEIGIPRIIDAQTHARRKRGARGQIERSVTGISRGDDNDNSGTLRYVSIRYPGTVFAPARELNSEAQLEPSRWCWQYRQELVADVAVNRI